MSSKRKSSMTTSPEGDPEVVEAEVMEVKGPVGAAAFGIDLPEDPEQAIDVLLSHLEESREERVQLAPAVIGGAEATGAHQHVPRIRLHDGHQSSSLLSPGGAL